jgi:hypothetical protein
MQRMMFLLLTGKYQRGEDGKILIRENLDGNMERFPVNAERCDGDHDSADTMINGGCNRVVPEADRKNLELGARDPFMFHVSKDAPRRKTRRHQPPKCQ